MSGAPQLREQLRSTFDRDAADANAYEPKPQPTAPALIAKPSTEFIAGEIPAADETGAADTVPVETMADDDALVEEASTENAASDPLDQTLETHRRALLGDRYQAPTSPQRQITYDDVLAEVRREMAQGRQRPAAPKQKTLTTQELAKQYLSKRLQRRAAHR